MRSDPDIIIGKYNNLSIIQIYGTTNKKTRSQYSFCAR